MDARIHFREKRDIFQWEAQIRENKKGSFFQAEVHEIFEKK